MIREQKNQDSLVYKALSPIVAALLEKEVAELKRLEAKDEKDLTTYEKDRLHELQMKHGTHSERESRKASTYEGKSGVTINLSKD